MRYVQRDAEGAIVGIFANPQPGYAEAALPDDDAELVAFNNPIPDVTALQARRAMRAAGIYDAVKAAVDAHSDPDVQDSWEYMTVWRHDAHWVNTLAASLGLSSEALDALFLTAATL